MLEARQTVKVELEVKAQFHTETTDSYNIIAELPGGKKKDEIVMIGAHFDSWHSGTGATDNGAGSAVMIEVMRVLKTLNLRLDRTVRLALWGGEEQGLLGSREYVKAHFADPMTLALKPEQKEGIEDPIEMERVADANLDQAPSRFICSADPEEVVERIAVYVELGFEELLLHAPGEDQSRFLDQFSADVLPVLRDKTFRAHPAEPGASG